MVYFKGLHYWSADVKFMVWLVLLVNKDKTAAQSYQT